MSSDKTRAERIEEAATKFCDAARCSAVIGPHHEFQELEEALALPPDPPRYDDPDGVRKALSKASRRVAAQQEIIDSLLTKQGGLREKIRRLQKLISELKDGKQAKQEAGSSTGSPPGEAVELATTRQDQDGSSGSRLDGQREPGAVTPRGDEKLRELRSTFVRQLKDAQHGRRSKSNLGLDHSIAAIDRLLAAAPKDPEPAEPAQDDEDVAARWDAISGFLLRHHNYAGSMDAKVVADAVAKGSEIIGRLAREKADLRAKLAAAESALVARHGGEPLALLAELDEARAKLAAAHEQLRCPDCGCATPEEAEAGECGCDSPVCSVEVTTTVAKELCDVAKKLAAAEARIAAIVEWTHQYGASLCPFGKYTDSFGDGMRAAKEKVSRLADLGKGGA